MKEKLVALLGGFAIALVGAIIVAFIFGFPLMLLWNWLMPMIFGLPKVTFIQAAGLLLLRALLFPSPNNSSSKK